MSSGVPPAGPKKRRKAKVKAVIVSDPIRLLHRNPGMAKSDYTDDYRMAVREEPEAVSEVEQKRISDQARQNFNLVHAEEEARRDVRSFKAKLSAARAQAAKKGIDITPEIRRMEAALDDAVKRLDAAA